jgi:mandelamide amidase
MDPFNAIVPGTERAAPAGRRLIVKDSIDVAGLATRAGSPALPDRPAAESAPIVRLLEAAGWMVCGKANMHELSFGVTSANAWHGPVRNPHDPSRVPGGSSGGTAAALAAGLADAGLGGDTGGSLRIPAAFCGVVGFRSSRGRYPVEGAYGLSPSRDVLGPMARTVAKVESLDRALVGRAAAIAPAAIAGLRLGVPRDPFYAGLDLATEIAMDAALKRLAAAGAVLVDLPMPEIGPMRRLLDFATAGYEIEATWRGYAAELGLSLAAIIDRIESPDVKAALRDLARGRGPSEADYRAAMDEHRPALRAFLADRFASADVAALVVPTVPVIAPPIGAETVILGGEETTVFAALTRNSWPASVADLPSLSLPAPVEGGLPVGLQIDGPQGTDDRLLAIALAVEAALRRTDISLA